MSEFREVSKLGVPEVKLGQLWRRSNGVVYVVQEERTWRGREVLLVPYFVPEGLRARKTWKWDKAVRSELVRIVVWD